MEFYRTLKTVEITQGHKIGLSDAQAVPRLTSLKPGKKGVYQVLQTIQFKRGEIIGFSGDPPKGLPVEPCELEERG